MSASILSINPLRPTHEYPKILQVSPSIIDQLTRVHADSRVETADRGTVLVERSGVITRSGLVVELGKKEQILMLVDQHIDPTGSSPTIEQRLRAFVRDRRISFPQDAEIAFHTHPGSSAPSHPEGSTHGMGDIGILAINSTERDRQSRAFHKNVLVAKHAIYLMISTKETRNKGINRSNFRGFGASRPRATGYSIPEMMEAQAMAWARAYALVVYKYDREARHFQRM